MDVLSLKLGRASSQCEGHFVKNQKKMSNFRKSKKMKNWKIHFLEICNFSKKLKKGNERKNQKNKKFEARAPHFFIFCNFSFIFLFHLFGKAANFQKINFPFFNFFDFSEICQFFFIFYEIALTLVGFST